MLSASSCSRWVIAAGIEIMLGAGASPVRAAGR
jgi:hypothetical protein